MATRILDNKKERRLQPAFGLWAKYRPEKAEFAFKAKTAKSAVPWQKKARKALADVTGVTPIVSSRLNPRVIEETDKGDYIREKILLQTAPNVIMPIYLLLPKGVVKPRTVLAFHGHGYGVNDIVGLWNDGRERDTPEGYHKDFGVALCRAGFAVAAPEISCFGERQTDFSYLNTSIGQQEPSTCHHSSALAFHLGTSVLGMRVHDGKRLVDYLRTRKDINSRRLGAMGISGGGMHTFFSTCLDPRIKACVVSGYFSTFKDSILGMNHCFCNFVPGLARFGEMSDLAGLIAPRPMLVEAGTYDPIFPIKAVKKGVSDAKKVYAVFDAEEKLQTDIFEGRHMISGAKAYQFLQDHL